MVSFMNTRNLLILSLKALELTPSLRWTLRRNASIPACVATLSPQISPWTKFRRKDVCVCARARVDVRACACALFPSAPGSPAALALQHRAAVCAVGPPLWGEAAPSSGCDGRERRSDGGALHGSTALPAVEGTHTGARARAHARTHTCFTPAASPNEKAQRNVRG